MAVSQRTQSVGMCESSAHVSFAYRELRNIWPDHSRFDAREPDHFPEFMSTSLVRNPHCAVMLAALASFTAMSTSRAMRASKSSGVMIIGSTPSFASFSLMAALSIVATVSR